MVLRFTGALFKKLWLVAAVLIILYALITVLGRQLLPLANRYQDSINHYLSDLLGLEVEALGFDGRWQGFSPRLGVHDLKISGGSPDGEITIDEMFAEFNLYKSLVNRLPVWNELSLGNVAFTAVEDAQGQWTVAGFAVGQGGDTDMQFLLDILLDSRLLRIDSVAVDVRFFSGVETRVTATDLQIENGSGFHRVLAQLGVGARTESQHKNSAKLIIEGRGDPREGENFTGNGYLTFSRINIDASINTLLRKLFPEQVQKLGNVETDLDLSLWFDWQNFGAVNLIGKLSAAEIPMDWFQAPSLTDVNAELTGWYRQGQDWGVSVQQFTAGWGQEQLGPFNLEFRQGVGARWEALQWNLDALSLPQLTRLAGKAEVLPETVRQQLATLSLQGRLKNIRLELDLSQEKPAPLLKANLVDVGNDSLKSSPASRGVNGYLEASLYHGFVELDSPESFRLYFPQVYDDFMPFGAIRGRVDWHWQPDLQSVTVVSGPLSIDGEEGKGLAYLNVLLPTSKQVFEPQMTLMVAIRNSHSRYMPRYLPRVLPQNLSSWLYSAVGESPVPEVGFLWRGSLTKANVMGRAIQLFVQTNDGNLDYQQGWPGITQLDAKMVLDNGNFDAWVSGGRLGEALLKSASVNVRSTDDGPLLGVKGRLQAESGYALSVLGDSPVGDRLGDFRAWSLDGKSVIGLELNIPLATGGRGEKYDVGITVKNATLALPGSNLKFNKIYGDVDFSLEKGLVSRGLKGEFLGNPLRATVTTTADETRVDVEGSVASESLKPYLGQFGDYVSGVTDVVGQFHIPIKGSTTLPFLELVSTTTGIDLNLPEPLFKAADKTSPLSLRLTFDKAFGVEAHWQDLAAARWVVENGVFSRGELAILGESATLPAERGLLISGDLPAVDWTQWRPLLAPDKPNQAAIAPDEKDGGGPGLMAVIKPRLALTLDDLAIAGNELGATTLKGTWQSDGWQLGVESELVAGDITIPSDADAPLDLALSYLHLPASARDEAVSEEESRLDSLMPADVPSMNIIIQSLKLGDMAYGSLGFHSRQIDHGVHFSNISGTIKGFSLGIPSSDTSENAPVELVWTENEGKHLSYFSGTLVSSGLADAFELWGYPRALDAKNSAFVIDGTWPGKPWDVSLTTIDGYLGLHLQDGQFYKAAGTTTNAFFKLVSLVNFDTWLRRLRFDFSDLFSQGVSFDEMKGGLLLNHGDILFDDPVVTTMPSGKIRLLGKADLNNNLLDARLVATMPVGTNLPWVVGALGGLPAAAGVYLTGKLFEKQVDRLSSISYKVTGSMDDPKLEVDKIFSDKTD